MGRLLTGPTSTTFQRLFIPSVCLLITFLGYTSQWLFNTAHALDPGPMTKREATIFNILLACVWSTYYKACTVPPGLYIFPPSDDKTQHPEPPSSPPSSSSSTAELPTQSDPTTQPDDPALLPPPRWCSKCAAPKPPRAHHCRLCGHCIPKMDHHCPWTGQCVSLQTFPHVLRFLLYATLALAYLHAALLLPRLRALLACAASAHRGPRVPAMAHLVLLALVAAAAGLVLLVLLAAAARACLLNQTMIEGWELARHEAVLARRGAAAARVERVEFPYDLSFFANVAQAMGSRNPLAWLDPFVGGHPVVAPHPQTQAQKTQAPGGGGSSNTVDTTGWEYEENGFNARTGMWPPPDPDKTRRGARRRPPWAAQRQQQRLAEEIAALEGRWRDPAGEVAAFRVRQDADLRRFQRAAEELGYEYVDSESGEGEFDDDDDDDGGGGGGGGGGDGGGDDNDGEDAPPVRAGKTPHEQGVDGEPGWTNAEGDRLRDYGVDEDAEDDDEDIPLSELLRRRKALRGPET